MHQLDDVSELLDQTSEWTKGDGDNSDIVVSSRARLARNIRGFPFTHKTNSEQAEQLEKNLRENIASVPSLDDSYYFHVHGLSPESSEFLVERHLISREHAEGQKSRSVVFDEEERMAIMINEEDHLRMQVMRSGFNLEEAWKQLNEMDTKLEEKMGYAFSPKYGYLTACPTNAGTALRVSVMLHLPILNMADEMDKVFKSLSQINFTARGLYGEGTQASGDFFQISNQVTMNHSEDEFVEQLREMVPEIVKFEKEWRSRMHENDPVLIEDRIWRAVGTLKNARRISSEEAMQCLSAIRLGKTMDILNGVSIPKLNEMVLYSLPAHLQKKHESSLDPEDRDRYRATFLRELLEEL